MTFIYDEEPETPPAPEPVRNIDLTAKLNEMAESMADHSDTFIEIGRDEFQLMDVLTLQALTELTGASTEEGTRVDKFVDGVVAMIHPNDRRKFRQFIKVNDLTLPQFEVIAEAIMEAISGNE